MRGTLLCVPAVSCYTRGWEASAPMRRLPVPTPLAPCFSVLYFSFFFFLALGSSCLHLQVLWMAGASQCFLLLFLLFLLSFFLSHTENWNVLFPLTLKHPAPHKPKLNVKPIYPDALEWWESIGRLGSCWNDVSPEILGLWPIKVTVWLV